MSRHDEAIERTKRLVELTQRATFQLGTLGGCYARAGDSEQAHEILSELRDRSSRENVSPMHFAWILSALCDNDAACECLGGAYEQRQPMLTHMQFAFLNNVRSVPRLRAILERMKLEHILDVS